MKNEGMGKISTIPKEAYEDSSVDLIYRAYLDAYILK
jgi:hypothetical protein